MNRKVMSVTTSAGTFVFYKAVFYDTLYDYEGIFCLSLLAGTTVTAGHLIDNNSRTMSRPRTCCEAVTALCMGSEREAARLGVSHHKIFVVGHAPLSAF